MLGNTDFRIGNIVNYIDDDSDFSCISVVEMVGKFKISLSNKKGKILTNYDCITSVSLSEKILEGLGAKKVVPRAGVYSAYLIKGLRLELSNSGNYYYKGNVIKLHGLQNLYQSTYQQELEVVL